MNRMIASLAVSSCMILGLPSLAHAKGHMGEINKIAHDTVAGMGLTEYQTRHMHVGDDVTLYSGRGDHKVVIGHTKIGKAPNNHIWGLSTNYVLNSVAHSTAVAPRSEPAKSAPAAPAAKPAVASKPRAEKSHVGSALSASLTHEMQDHRASGFHLNGWEIALIFLGGFVGVALIILAISERTNYTNFGEMFAEWLAEKKSGGTRKSSLHLQPTPLSPGPQGLSPEEVRVQQLGPLDETALEAELNARREAGHVPEPTVLQPAQPLKAEEPVTVPVTAEPAAANVQKDAPAQPIAASAPRAPRTPRERTRVSHLAGARVNEQPSPIPEKKDEPPQTSPNGVPVDDDLARIKEDLLKQPPVPRKGERLVDASPPVTQAPQEPPVVAKDEIPADA